MVDSKNNSRRPIGVALPLPSATARVEDNGGSLTVSDVLDGPAFTRWLESTAAVMALGLLEVPAILEATTREAHVLQLKLDDQGDEARLAAAEWIAALTTRDDLGSFAFRLGCGCGLVVTSRGGL